MIDKPLPRPVKVWDDMTDQERIRHCRRHDCQFYLTCLDTAVQAGWSNFTCAWCRAFTGRHVDREEAQLEACGCWELLATAVRLWREDDKERLQKCDAF